MTRKIMLLLATLTFGLAPLAGCNTVQGMGKDVEKAGQKVQDEAAEHKKY
jgi:predicted small secreted protein